MKAYGGVDVWVTMQTVNVGIYVRELVRVPTFDIKTRSEAYIQITNRTWMWCEGRSRFWTILLIKGVSQIQDDANLQIYISLGYANNVKETKEWLLY
jgi:hypothetical protein